MMTRWRSLVMGAALVVALGAASTAQAGPISYTYSGDPGFQIVHPNVGNGGIGFVAQTGSGVGPGGGALGALLTPIASNGSGAIGSFSGVNYNTGLTINDSGGGSHTFTFSGQLTGTLAPGNDTLQNTFTSSTTQSFQIGSNMYTVHINSMALPGVSTLGAVTYNVQVAPSNVAAAPEPSTLMLSGLGASVLGFFSWRRRRNLAAALA